MATLTTNLVAKEDDRLVFGGREPDQLSGFWQSVVNLVKNLVGSGMLSLSFALAAWCGSGSAMEPSVLLLVACGAMSTYGFALIGDCCDIAGEGSYQGAWSTSVSFQTRWIPGLACFGKVVFTEISYSMILGDCFSDILASTGAFSSLSHWYMRALTILTITLVFLLPLCSLKSLAPLAKFSFLGVLSNVYICFFIGLRYFDGSYLRGGAWFQEAGVQPTFTEPCSLSTLFSAKSLLLVSMLASAFMCHYNAPLFYEQLSPGKSSKLARFNMVAVIGFGISGTIFTMVMLGGFMTFGAPSPGFILNGYAPADRLAFIARVSVGLSVMMSYPLVFVNLRRQAVELFGGQVEILERRQPVVVTVSLLAIVTCVAVYLTNLGKVVALAGSAFGSFLIYIGPGVMAIGARYKLLRPQVVLQMVAQFLLVVVGLILAFVGSYEVIRK